MKGAFVILIFLIIAGIIVWLLDRFYYSPRHKSQTDAAPQPDAEAPGADRQEEGEGECCGMHIVCEKDTLVNFSTEAVYYDDEELDRFRGRASSDYEDSEIEEFRDVLLTLRPEEVAGWARSLQVRGVALPEVVKDELLMLVAERRRELAHNDTENGAV